MKVSHLPPGLESKVNRRQEFHQAATPSHTCEGHAGDEGVLLGVTRQFKMIVVIVIMIMTLIGKSFSGDTLVRGQSFPTATKTFVVDPLDVPAHNGGVALWV